MSWDPIGNLLLLLEAKLAADVAMLRLVKAACEGNADAGAALLEATGLLQQIASLADPITPGEGSDESGGILAGHVARVRSQIARLREMKFKTHDVLILRGALYGERTLQVSGLSALSLGQRPFLVLKILVRHALANPGAYLSVHEIVNALLEDPIRQNAGIWEDVVPEDVHKTIRGLRESLEEAGGNPRLIELSRSYGAGYRLSTPCSNIFLEDLDVE